MAIHLRNIQNSVNLQRKPPVRMGFHSLHAGLHVGLALFRILNETGLQETMFGLNPIVQDIRRMEDEEFGSIVFEEYDEQYMYFFGIALLLFVIEMLIGERKPRRKLFEL